MGKTGVRSFCDRIEILSSYLPFFPPIRGIIYIALIYDDKQEILYDALPPYYIKKIKEINKVPFKMNLEEVRDYALSMDEASINPGKSDNEDEGNLKQKRIKLSPIIRKGVTETVKTPRNQFLMVKREYVVLFVVRLSIHQLCVVLKPNLRQPQTKKRRAKSSLCICINE
jgi:hypothetical protein